MPQKRNQKNPNQTKESPQVLEMPNQTKDIPHSTQKPSRGKYVSKILENSKQSGKITKQENYLSKYVQKPTFTKDSSNSAKKANTTFIITTDGQQNPNPGTSYISPYAQIPLKNRSRATQTRDAVNEILNTKNESSSIKNNSLENKNSCSKNSSTGKNMDTKNSSSSLNKGIITEKNESKDDRKKASKNNSKIDENINNAETNNYTTEIKNKFQGIDVNNRKQLNREQVNKKIITEKKKSDRKTRTKTTKNKSKYAEDKNKRTEDKKLKV